MDIHSELPSLRATVRLVGQGKSKGKPAPLPIFYDVKFYPYTPPGVDPVFAVTGGCHAIICRCLLEQNHSIEIIRWFEDEDDCAPDGEDLRYNSIAWSQAENGDPLVCVSGNTSQIKVLNVKTGELVTTLIGHGDDINDLVVSPTNPSILASCSIDRSVRLWSLDPAHKEHPLGAICFNQANKDQVLTLAYHRKGRYILSAGMSTRIDLWRVPDNLQEHAASEKPAMIHYPQFSTTEIHTDFIDCIEWYNDLVISHAARENKIIIWRIDEFNSDLPPPEAPLIPESNAVNSKWPVTIPSSSNSDTRSIWGGRFQRLLQFDLPWHEQFYIRFGLFHELDRHPVLVAGNERSRAYFWDLQRLEEAGTGEHISHSKIDAPLDARGPPSAPGRHIREESSVSNASSAQSGTSGTSSATTKAKKKSTNALSSTKESRDRRGISGPFRSVKVHKEIEIPKYNFTFRQFDWSSDGQWCVGVGDLGLINIFHRWKNGVPPPHVETTITIPIR